MTNIISGNFAANGDSDEFVAKKFTILLGSDTNENFGGGTLEIKYKQDDQKDWTTDAITYTASRVITSEEFVAGIKCKLTLAGSTSPDLDYSIKYV